MAPSVLVLALLIGILSTGASGEGNKTKMISTGKARNLQVGLWGGEHISMQVSDSGAVLAFDCAHGAIDNVITLDDNGRFDVKGYFVMEQGGPVRPGEGDEKRPARYRGSLKGNSLTLTITLNNSAEPIDTFTLTHGRRPLLTKCL